MAKTAGKIAGKSILRSLRRAEFEIFVAKGSFVKSVLLSDFQFISFRIFHFITRLRLVLTTFLFLWHCKKKKIVATFSCFLPRAVLLFQLLF